MRRRDVVLSIAGGVLVVLYVAFAPASAPILTDVAALALDHWYVGVAAVAASIVLRSRPPWHGLARMLGVIGVTWVTFFVGYAVALVLVFALFPIGY